MAVNVVSFLFFWCSTGALGSTLLGAGFFYCILSASSLDPKLHRGSQGPLRPGVAFLTTSRLSPTGTWTQLNWPQLIRAQRPLRPDVAFPTTFPLQLSGTQLAWLLSWLSYIIVQCPLDRPRNLWNRMFNRHQAEITVMQFRGHSLPVRQSMRVSWDFFFTSSHFICQFLPTRFPLITAIRMCHFLPVHHLEWHFWALSKGQNITKGYSSLPKFLEPEPHHPCSLVSYPEHFFSF